MFESSQRGARRLALSAALAAACGEPAPPANVQDPSTDTQASDEATTTDDADADVGDTLDDTGPRMPATACAAETDVTGAPQSIAEAVAFINALPHPVTLDCFLERLARPLQLTATTSTISLQPAVGARSPRVFLFSGALIMSVATDGVPGRSLLEFGELVAPTQSIKGEVAFPVDQPLSVTAPMERVRDGLGTSCRFCHGSESATDDYDFSFVSDALQFREIELVELSAVQAEHEACEPSVEPDRCVRLDALLAFGPVTQGEFPEELQTIYDYE